MEDFTIDADQAQVISVARSSQVVDRPFAAHRAEEPVEAQGFEGPEV